MFSSLTINLNLEYNITTTTYLVSGFSPVSHRGRDLTNILCVYERMAGLKTTVCTSIYINIGIYIIYFATSFVCCLLGFVLEGPVYQAIKKIFG